MGRRSILKKNRRCYFCMILGIFILVAFQPALAQAQHQKVLTSEDYAHAEKFLGQFMSPLVFGASVRVNWIEETLFWYRNDIPEGYEFVLGDAKKKLRTRAFDHQKLAAALSEAAGTKYEPFNLPFQSFEFSENKKSII